MDSPNPIIQAAAECGRTHGFEKRSSSWYRTEDETIAVYQVQRSSFGPQFYVNVALWLLPLGAHHYPKERECHIRTRLSQLVDDASSGLDDTLNLEFSMSASERQNNLQRLLEIYMIPLLDRSATIAGILDETNPLLARSLVTAAAQEMLDSFQAT